MTELMDLLQVMAGNVWLYGVTFLVILSILVFVHEWGHYIVAKMCGVHIETFSIGFGKELFAFVDKSGTRWRFALIPLGGYVKMYGDTDPASAGHTENVDGHAMTTHDRQKAFFAKSILQRSAIVFAGPAVNFLFAIAIFAILFSTLGRPVTPPILAAVEVGGAAEAAGLEPQDKVLAVDGRRVSQFEDIRTTVTLALDTPLVFTVQRGDETKNITVTPRRKEEQDRFGFKHERGYIGVLSPSNGLALSSIKAVEGEATGEDLRQTAKLLTANMDKVFTVSMTDSSPESGGLAHLMVHPSAVQNKDLASDDFETVKKSGLVLATHPSENRVVYLPVAAVAQGVIQTGDAIGGTLKAIGQIIMGTRSATELGGVIRIGAVAGDMAAQGFIAILTFMALLSINLGLINLFPIPMLDGGHLVFYGIEAIRGKPLPDQVLDYAFRVGLVILVALMVFSNLNDILQLVFKS
jgi:regulator of sigma E protease